MLIGDELLQEILDYRVDEKHRLRGDFSEVEIRARDQLQESLAHRLRDFFLGASPSETESMFDALKSEDHCFTQIGRDRLHERLGVLRKPSVLVWETRAPSNATGLDDD